MKGPKVSAVTSMFPASLMKNRAPPVVATPAVEIGTATVMLLKEGDVAVGLS